MVSRPNPKPGKPAVVQNAKAVVPATSVTAPLRAAQSKGAGAASVKDYSAHDPETSFPSIKSFLDEFTRLGQEDPTEGARFVARNLKTIVGILEVAAYMEFGADWEAACGVVERRVIENSGS